MIVWLGAGVLAVLLAWIFSRSWQKPEPVAVRSAEPRSMKPAGSAKAVASMKPAAAAKSPANLIDWSTQSPEIPKIPSLVEDDDLEITVVTASPLSESVIRAMAGQDGTAPAPEPAPPSPEASRVEVIYEEEAEVEEITSPFARILVSAQGQSDGGKVRPRNEDSLLVYPDRSLFAVADGMGGYEGGQIASALAVETLKASFETSVFDGRTESSVAVPRRGREMACAIQMANQAILAKSKTDAALAQMGTTIVAARFSPNKQRVYIGHVGDSRCYRLRGKTLRQLTTDHTMKQLGMKGPGSNHLFQAVGIAPKITIDLIVDKPRAGDIYLLCSDGLSKMATDDQIRDMLLLETDIEAAMYSLIELANDQGGKDNVTVILVKVVERPALQKH
jgi:serine/threonine protein phosphatase PrpC